MTAHTLLFLPRLGMGELLVILLVVLLLFGAKRIPDLMRSFGKGIKSFKEGLDGTPESEKRTTTDRTDATHPDPHERE